MWRRAYLVSPYHLLLIFLLLSFGWVSAEDLDARRFISVLIGRKSDERAVNFSCRKLGERCRALPPCCESMACYHAAGFVLNKSGVCVKCVKEGQWCQNDDQCCANFQCDRGNALWIDGTCQRYRRSGPCYRDGQCVTKCVKEWYQPRGECT